MWFWEYIIKIYNEVDSVEEERSGVVCGSDITEAMQGIYSHYGEDIINVLTLKAIFEGDCFDFAEVEQEEDFDYQIFRKK